MQNKHTQRESIYHIKLKGVLNRSMVDWFGDISILPQENDETLLIGQFTDQAALRGFLEQLWNLNFSLLSVEKVKNSKPK